MLLVETSELAGSNGEKTGRYRRTYRTDDPESGPFGLCKCEGGHISIKDAEDCPEARIAEDRLMGRKPKKADSLEAKIDRQGVRKFSDAMIDKLDKKRAEGRDGWYDPDQCSVEYLSKLLWEHMEKGDPVDVGNLAMMLYNREAGISPKVFEVNDTEFMSTLSDYWDAAYEAGEEGLVHDTEDGLHQSILSRLTALYRATHKYFDDPALDGTDGAHPAWWRGNDRGVEAVVSIVNSILDGERDGGSFGYAPLAEMRERLVLIRDVVKDGTETVVKRQSQKIFDQKKEIDELKEKLRDMHRRTQKAESTAYKMLKHADVQNRATAWDYYWKFRMEDRAWGAQTILSSLLYTTKGMWTGKAVRKAIKDTIDSLKG